MGRAPNFTYEEVRTAALTQRSATKWLPLKIGGHIRGEFRRHWWLLKQIYGYIARTALLYTQICVFVGYLGTNYALYVHIYAKLCE